MRTIAEIQKLAWDFCLRFGICDFTFSLEQIARIINQNEWKLFSYQSCEGKAFMKEMKIEKYSKTKKGFTFVYVGECERRFAILYDNRLRTRELYFTLFHEIGHILCDHSYFGNISGNGKNPQETLSQRQEADYFACEVLAPSCVLNHLKVYTAKEIRQLSCLPTKYAVLYAAQQQKREAEPNLDEALRMLEQYKSTFLELQQDAKFVKPRKLWRSPLFIGGCAALAGIVIVVGLILWGRGESFAPYLQPEASISQPTGMPIPATGEVFVTKTGDRYHEKSCSHIQGRDILQISVSEATRMGYSPCKDCILDQKSESGASSTDQ